MRRTLLAGALCTLALAAPAQVKLRPGELDITISDPEAMVTIQTATHSGKGRTSTSVRLEGVPGRRAGAGRGQRMSPVELALCLAAFAAASNATRPQRRAE